MRRSDQIAAMVVFMTAAATMGTAAAAAQCPRGAASAIEVAAPGVTQEVILDGGVSYLGRVMNDQDPVRFQLLSGDVLELGHSRIQCVRPVDGQLHEGQFWPADPNTTRLFFGPTGRALPQGVGYISVFELIMPMVAFGVTDRITMAGGMPLFFGSEGIELLWLAPKIEVIRTPTFRGSAGVLALFAPGEGENVGVFYGVGTFGRTTDLAATIGAGWGYSTETGIFQTPALMAGFESRVSRRIKLISENYLFPDERFGIISFGPRFIGDRLAADLGLAAPIGAGEFFAFPLINFVYNW
jgi:hypothetical protein